ncbi:HNH endonuclease [Neomicrococcus lactis]|uniref:Putative restriction endonuclease n=1 Tax=Neomicrococcus lactis TaxID=732241 RepID=A0A7W8YBQ6_9MICC|nr:putative restriction endonuclease [Neomicrococcus lactis]
MATSADRENKLRLEAIEWLSMVTDNGRLPLTREEIAEFRFEGERFRLIDQSRGIWRPKGFVGALTIVTTFREPGKERPYEDEIGADGLPRYMWEGDDPFLFTNVALRESMKRQLPMIWFVGIGRSPARYQVVAPVFLVDEEPHLQRFVVAPMDSAAIIPDVVGQESPIQETIRRYLRTETTVRLHQPVFRAAVLRAYETRCAVCNLGHYQLLDAAHIMPDRHDLGIASVVNGMALCKIHHAAFDSNILGVTPDFVVKIRPDLLEEIDGPMLQHGLKELHDSKLMKLPENKKEQPRRDLLELAYERFTSAGVA